MPQRPVAPFPVPEPYYDEYEDDFDAYEPRHESFLRNPYILAAIAVVGAIVMAIVVVAMAGGGGSGGRGGQTAVATEDPLTPKPAGMVVDSIAAATVREGPGTGGDVGSLPRGQKVTVTGRDADAKWFQIVFPQNSTLRGWVPASALKVADLNIQSIAIASVTPIARATVPPTQPAVIATEPPTATPTITSTPIPGPDLAVTMACTPGAPVAVTIRNAGEAPVLRSATVSVLIGSQVRSTTQVQLNLEPNAAVTFPTDQVVSTPSTSVQVTLLGSPTDIDPADNSAQCTVQGSTTATPAVSTPANSTPAATTTAGPTRTPTVQTVSP